ncbi:MAG: class I SAM-dependent methyltransferase [Desulfobacterales bacterium]
MKGKTISLLQSGDFIGMVRHLFRKRVVNALALPLYAYIIPPLTRALMPACRDTQINGLFEVKKTSDITDHLAVLFCEVLKSDPSLVVELGTRKGDSTRALLQAASIAGAKMISVDMMDCSQFVDDDSMKNTWRFVQADDVAFAGEFVVWCRSNGFPETVDVLFVDTSHEYEHTLAEIRAWFPLLSERGKVIFHDTHMKRYVKRKNGSIVKGWNNERGVIRAIEETLGRAYDETAPFIDRLGGWLIEHLPYSSGLTIMTRMGDEKS